MPYTGAESTSRPSCIATIKGDQVVFSAQKTAWVCNGTVAQYSALFCGCDRGSGLGKVALLVTRGVTQGKPLEKTGQQVLPRGAIYFDKEEIDKRRCSCLRIYAPQQAWIDQN